MRGSNSFQDREDIVYYGVSGNTYLDIHGLMSVIKIPYSTAYRKTRQIMENLEGEHRVKYMGRDLYDLDFCFSWWRHYTDLKREGKI